MNEVVIHGVGVAACCCARLLGESGIRVFVEGTPRDVSPTLMLNDQTQILLRDVFRTGDLFKNAAKITKRIVAWGPKAEPLTFPHSGVVIGEADLLARLWPLVNAEKDFAGTGEWNVYCSRTSLPSVSQYEFGSRWACATPVSLNQSAERDACWVEATRSGWLFLLPSGGLISVGGAPEVLLRESRLVAQQILNLGSASGSFPAYPRIVVPLCGPDWIACGSAAMGFDPIAGEGAGHAMRQGILASAVIRAAAGGQPAEALSAHYRSRMMNGFVRHLTEVAGFYNPDFGPWWEAELETLQKSANAVRHQLTAEQGVGYRLVDFELQPV